MSYNNELKKYVTEKMRMERELEQRFLPLDYELPIELAASFVKGYESFYKISKLPLSKFLTNPYLQNLQIPEIQVGTMKLDQSKKIKARTIFSTNEIQRNKSNLQTFREYGYVSKDLNLPTLYDTTHNQSWMSVEPSEINSFAPFLNIAYGNVLVMGCGLGYLAYMLSQKEDVKKITIIEKDPNVVKIFQDHLLPQFKNATKIQIFCADAIEVLALQNLEQFDFCSIDIWHNLSDMFPLYLTCLFYERKHPHTKFHYWLERELHTAIDTMLLEQIVSEENYKNEIGMMFHEILKSIPIQRIEDIKKLIQLNKRDLLKKWIADHPKDTFELTMLLSQLQIRKRQKDLEKSGK